MNKYVRITRRSFLHTSVWLSAFGLSGAAHALIKLVASSTPDPLALSLASFFIHNESAKIIGLEYLRCAPREADARLLVDLICSCQAEHKLELAKADMEQRRELLLLQQRQDFERGRIVKVQGWILSETEVRLCALAALV